MSIRLEVTIDDYHSQNRLGISARECDETETAPAYHPRLLPEGREVAPEFLLICLKTRSRIARFAHRNALDIRRLYLCACFRAKVHFAVEVAGEVAQQLVWLRSRNFLNAAFSKSREIACSLRAGSKRYTLKTRDGSHQCPTFSLRR